jgi:DNA modification methylase
MIEPYWQSDDGRHTVYCADCLGVLPQLADDSFDLLLTDPPYPNLKGGSVLSEAFGKMGTVNHVSVSVGTPWGSSLDWAKDAWRVAKHGAIVFASYQSVAEVRQAFADAHAMCMFTGYKRNSPPTGKNCPRYTTEFAWGLSKRPGLKWGAFIDTHFDIPGLQAGCMATERILREGSKQAAHPCQKPLALMRELLACNPSSVVDPFAGTGTTLIACLEAGIPCTAIENDQGYCDIAVKRIKDALAQLPLMEAAG